MLAETTDDIAARLRRNLGRARAFVLLHGSGGGGGQGRPNVEEGDLLRAAVLFAHAALEDVLRSVESLRLPSAPGEAFSSRGFMFPPIGSGSSPRETIKLQDLTAFRGQTVDELLRKAIDQYLEKSNYNHIQDILSALQRSSIQVEIKADDKTRLAAMMTRRHLIAHRADVNPLNGQGYGPVAPIHELDVERWIGAVETVTGHIIAQLKGGTP